MASRLRDDGNKGRKGTIDAGRLPLCSGSASGSVSDSDKIFSAGSLVPLGNSSDIGSKPIAGVYKLANSFANARLGLSQLINRSPAHCNRRNTSVLTLPGAACPCNRCSEAEWGCSVTQMSGTPSATLFRNFLRPEECAHLIETAEGIGMQRSAVLGNVVTPDRTSSETTLLPRETEIVSCIEKRIAHVVGAPVANCGPLSVLHYEENQRFRLHYDWSATVPRIHTAIMYLTSPKFGGETLFPNAVGSPAAGQGWRQHMMGGLVVDACAGTLLLFRNVNEMGDIDRTSLHESRAVTAGHKWAATMWIYDEPVNKRNRDLN